MKMSQTVDCLMDSYRKIGIHTGFGVLFAMMVAYDILYQPIIEQQTWLVRIIILSLASIISFIVGSQGWMVIFPMMVMDLFVAKEKEKLKRYGH